MLPHPLVTFANSRLINYLWTIKFNQIFICFFVVQLCQLNIVFGQQISTAREKQGASEKKSEKSSVDSTRLLGFCISENFLSQEDKFKNTDTVHYTSYAVAAKNTDLNTDKIFFEYNYEQLSLDVRDKINANKSTGKFIGEGILKIYLVELKGCKNENECLNKLNFLEEHAGVLHKISKGNGLVNLVVDLSLKSEELKEMMLQEGIVFNFINESFILK